jgi:hypothetical protein
MKLFCDNRAKNFMDLVLGKEPPWLGTLVPKGKTI